MNYNCLFFNAEFMGSLPSIRGIAINVMNIVLCLNISYFILSLISGIIFKTQRKNMLIIVGIIIIFLKRIYSGNRLRFVSILFTWKYEMIHVSCMSLIERFISETFTSKVFIQCRVHHFSYKVSGRFI